MSGNLQERIEKTEKRKALKDKIEKALTFHIGPYEGFILFLPLVPFVFMVEMIEYLFKKNQKWSDKKAEKVLYEVLVNAADMEDGELILSDNAFRWGVKNLSFLLKAWANIYKYDILDYLVEKFEIEGYIKEKRKCLGGYDIIFKPVDKGAEN